MKRPDPVLRHLTAVMLYAWSLVAISIAWHSTSLAPWLIWAAVGWLASVAAFQAVQATWRARRDWRAMAKRKSEATPPPSASAPLWPANVNDAVMRDYEAEHYPHHARHGSRDGNTATLPMPVEELREYDYEPVGGAL